MDGSLEWLNIRQPSRRYRRCAGGEAVNEIGTGLKQFAELMLKSLVAVAIMAAVSYAVCELRDGRKK